MAASIPKLFICYCREDGHWLERLERFLAVFPAPLCKQIDAFASLSIYVSINYRNVAFKDRDGRLLVNDKVKEIWDVALESIPALLTATEKDFRQILGVEDATVFPDLDSNEFVSDSRNRASVQSGQRGSLGA